MMRLGVIGLGMAVAPHASSLRELQEDGHIEVVGGWSPSEERRAAFQSGYGLPAAPSLETLLEGIDCSDYLGALEAQKFDLQILMHGSLPSGDDVAEALRTPQGI